MRGLGSATPWMGRVGFCSTILFVASLLALHAANLPEEPAHMSGFVHTSLGPLWVLALATFALGGVALTLELRRRLQRHPFRGAGIGMLWLAAAGALVLAACPVDADPANRTVLGLIHEDAAPVTFLLASCAMLVLAPAFHAAKGWKPFAALSAICGFLALSFAMAYVVATLAGDATAGIVQRLLVGSIVTWMLLVAVRLVRPQHDAQAPEPLARPRPTCAV